MSLDESPEVQLADLLRGEAFSAQVRSALGQAEDLPASQVHGLLERLPALAAKHALEAEQAAPTLADLLPQIGLELSPSEPVDLMLAPDLSAAIALRIMDGQPAVVALVPSAAGHRYVTRAALRQARQESYDAFRRKLERALAAAAGPSFPREALRSLAKEAWSTTARAFSGQWISYQCRGNPQHEFLGTPDTVWCICDNEHSGHTRARVDPI